jgi:uncharacterized protein YcfJ
MNVILRNTILATGMATGMAIATLAAAEITFYEQEGYGGRSFNTEEQISNFSRFGFNDRASSVVVTLDWWEVCEDPQFGGRCAVLRPGRYPSLLAMGLNNRISSVRAASRNPHGEDMRPWQGPAASYDYRWRHYERSFEAIVTSVRAVVGPPEQRCWVEREKVVQERSHNSNVPGAIFGALIGGVIGHQFGGGSGKDLATAGGAVTGAALGANASRGDDTRVIHRDVQHCTSGPNYARPEYWDVTYLFRGQEHRMQMTYPPGPTVTVNERGEPRE